MESFEELYLGNQPALLATNLNHGSGLNVSITMKLKHGIKDSQHVKKNLNALFDANNGEKNEVPLAEQVSLV
jgi:hypothetical protein